MIYGDNPQKINERQDALGLTTYTYVPQISAIMQSGNLYVYAVNNPVLYRDQTGTVITPANVVGAVIGAGGGALLGTLVADYYGLTGWQRNAAIAGFTAGGAVLGWFAGPLVEKLALSIAAELKIVTSSTIPIITQKLIASIDTLKYSNTVLGHTERTYTHSIQTIKMIMEACTPVKDAFLPNGLKWVVEGFYNGTSGLWELVIDLDKNTIVHFLFRS